MGAHEDAHLEVLLLPFTSSPFERLTILKELTSILSMLNLIAFSYSISLFNGLKPRHRACITSMIWLACGSAFALNTPPDPKLRQPVLDIYAGHSAARMLRDLANECAPQQRAQHARAFTVSAQLDSLYQSEKMNPGRNQRGSQLASVQAALVSKQGGSVPIASAPTAPAVANDKPRVTQPSSANVPPLEGVYMEQTTGFGVGGMMTFEFDAYAVFKDGTITSNINTLSGQQSARNSKDWGRWSRAGNGFAVQWGNGKSSQLSGSTFYRTFPAQSGETLQGTYRSIGGGGNTALGGGVMTVDARSITFSPNGQFNTAQTQGGSAPGVVASSSSKNSGTYRLDGHVIEMRYADGRVVRSGFYFFPNKGRKTDSTIGIGNRHYSRS